MASALDNSVAEGRTGVITNTTAYSVLCSGTTATNPQQSVSPGAAGGVMVSNGPAALPSFQIGGGVGVPVLLHSEILSSSAIAEFDGFFNSAYDSYLFTFNAVLPATNNVILYAQVGTSGPTYINSGYGWQNNTFLTVAQVFDGDTAGTQAILTCPNGTNGIGSSGLGVTGTMFLMGPNASSNPAMAVFNLGYVNADLSRLATINGYWQQPAAVLTAIKFYMSSGNIASGIIRMYGLKNS